MPEHTQHPQELSQSLGRYFLQYLRAWNPQLPPDGRPLSDLSEHRACTEKQAKDLTCHVFPTNFVGGAIGVMIPFTLTSAREWYVSDTLSSFDGRQAPSSCDSLTPFRQLLRMLESVAKALDTPTASCPPLSLLQPYRMELDVPLHMDMVTGRSLDLPLLVALFREWAAITEPGETLWGRGPVFCTGAFGAHPDRGFTFDAGGVVSKYQAFVDAFGPGHPCILPSNMIDALDNAGLPFRKWSGPLIVFDGSLHDLLQQAPFEELAGQLREHPISTQHLGDLPRFAQKLYDNVDFDSAQRIWRWLDHSSDKLPPAVEFQTWQQLALCALHKGKLLEAHKLVSSLEAHWEQHFHALAGLEDRALYCLNRGSYYFDRLESERFLSECETLIGAELAAVSLENRFMLYGQLCQCYMAVGEYDQAIECGQRALECVKLVSRSHALRSLNYLVHALLAKGRQQRDNTALEEAWTKLESDEKELCELESPRASINAYFRAYYRCEILRAQGETADDVAARIVPPDPAGSNDWCHAYYFMQYSLLRNPQTHVAQRKKAIQCLESLTSRSAASGQHPSVLTFLYTLLALYARNHDDNGYDFARLRSLQQTLRNFTEAGLPAWEARLELLLQAYKEDERPEKLEAVFDALPFF